MALPCGGLAMGRHGVNRLARTATCDSQVLETGEFRAEMIDPRSRRRSDAQSYLALAMESSCRFSASQWAFIWASVSPPAAVRS